MSKPTALVVDIRTICAPRVELTGEDIALWAHCRSGMNHLEFIAWLVGEFQTLDAIDPYCEK